VLVAIASFDRIGKNGQGCWASQNKIAEIVDCSKAHLSNILSDLRDCGYITSKLNPDHRRLRVHRVVYTERDFDFVETPKTGPSRRNKIVHPGVNHSESIVHQQNTDSSLGDELSVHSSKKNDSKNNDLQNATIVKTITKTIEDRDSLSWRGRDCAEAHSKSLPLADAEKYPPTANTRQPQATETAS
jgi:hypothetical protein